MPQPGDRTRSALVMREWELWHTYTSALTGAVPPLEAVARNLVRYGIADCAVTSDGEAFWYDPPFGKPVRADAESVDAAESPADVTQSSHAGQRLAIRSCTVELKATYDKTSASFHIPENITTWPLEAIGSWSRTRLAELRLFGPSPLPPPYVWAQLGACSFIARKPPSYSLLVYPILKIFSTGVVMVEFRMVSPDEPVHVHEYIEHYLNAPFTEFRWVTVPPGVAAWAPLAVPDETTFRWYRLPFTARSHWYHQREVMKRTQLEEMGDFTFEQTSLTEAKDQARMDQALKDSEPEVELLVREAIRDAAAAQGIHLSDKYEIERVDRKIQQTLLAEATGDDRSSYPLPPDADELSVDAAPLRPSTLPHDEPDEPDEPALLPNSFEIDWDRLEEHISRVADAGARRLGTETAMEVVNGPGVESETFSSLALTIMKVAAYVAGGSSRGPRRGVKLAFLGPGTRNDLIDHWAGRPHTHLFRFKQQSTTARENEERHREDFAAILNRAAILSPLPSTLALPASSRAFDDFGAYLGVGGTLWVHARRRQGTEDPESDRSNQAMRVHDNQVKVELLEYAYALHRRIADRALGIESKHRDQLDAILSAQRDLAEFEWAMQDTGAFGEIRSLLEHGLMEFGVPRLGQRITDALRVRQELASHRRSVTTTRWTTFIALVAGFLAVPPLVDEVFKPLWGWAEFPRPANDDAFALTLTTVAFVFMGLILLAGYVWARSGRRKL